MHSLKKSLLATTMLASLSFSAIAVEKTVDKKDTWGIDHIFATPALWQSAKQSLETDLSKITLCKGKLGESAQTLASCLETLFNLRQRYSEILAYATLSADTDLRNGKNTQRQQAASLLGTKMSQASSFVNPELLGVGQAKLKAFMTREHKLKPFNQFIKNVNRQGPHTLSTQGENILAAAGNVTGAPASIYSTLANADLPWPTLNLDGNDVRLDQSAFSKYRSHADRKVRKQVFDRFFGTLDNYKRTMGAILNTNVNGDYFNAQARNYDSSLSSAIAATNVPAGVYHALVKTTRENLSTFHRYLKLRGRILKIDDLQYYDIYTPLVKGEKHFTIEQGKELTLKSTRQLGEEYSAGLLKGFDERWMDVYPSQGKRAGAYMNGTVYSKHPFVLMNYNDDYYSVSTLTHEWGHALHSYLSNKNQPYPTAEYPVFVAEVASTFNQALLLDYMLKNSTSDEDKLFYLDGALEEIRGTYIRQTMFAEFELAIHEAVENGKPLTADTLNEMFLSLVRLYHGHDKGVMNVDELYGVEWAYVPHFYYNFYVYQYATSIAAASLLADEVLSKKPGALDKYLALLKAGGSDYAYELLKKSGVDMATSAPYEATFKRMNYIMDEIETILDKRK